MIYTHLKNNVVFKSWQKHVLRTSVGSVWGFFLAPNLGLDFSTFLAWLKNFKGMPIKCSCDTSGNDTYNNRIKILNDLDSLEYCHSYNPIILRNCFMDLISISSKEKKPNSWRQDWISYSFKTSYGNIVGILSVFK